MEENYVTLRVHAGIFSNPGWDNADFTGDKFIGDKQGDHHTTVLEIKLSDPATALARWEDRCNEVNRASVKEVSPGVYTGLRMGLWDKHAPAGA